MFPGCVVNNDAYQGGKEKDTSCNEKPPGLRVACVVLCDVIESTGGQEGNDDANGEGKDAGEECDGADNYFYCPFYGLFHNKTS